MKNRLTQILMVALAAVLLPLSVAAAPSLGSSFDFVASSAATSDAFPLVTSERSAPIWYDDSDFAGVFRAIGDLQNDLEKVTSRRPTTSAKRPKQSDIVLVGTLGKHAAIDALVANGKLDASDLDGKWESFVITTIDAPLPGVDQALVIAGSDKRGTIYGIYELCEQLGVSPWHWWADVPPLRRSAAYILPGRYASGEPVVRYRGIFLNNEAPALTGWANEKFGALNSEFYTKVFELLLRLRGNYLWPAMWDNAFNEDDPDNPRLADEYGIVMGTSHHEPMMRAHKEWTKRNEQYGNGQWNYATNAEALQRFFREGIARNKNYENLVTVGMRGDGDVAMASAGTIEDDIAQLEQIFTAQRAILSEEMGVDPATVPQLWALFTEVQRFYEAGLRPPDDVTLLWTDDNTGNLRRLPTAEERERSGGSGIYYHFDMHGGPYAFQWINTMPLPKIGEQMNLASEYGANQIWIVNVGDLKPLELPIEFFLRQAWNPAALDKDEIANYTRRWAERDFGPQHAAEIADIVSRYAKYNGWRKPGQVQPDTFSQLNYREADRVLEAWSELTEKAEGIYEQLPAAQRDAFFQLVLHPTKASAIVAKINILAGRNHLYARQGRASANALAKRVRQLFQEDQALSDLYNRELADGKWNHLMDQAHLGQWSWEPPVRNIMPPVSELLPRDDNEYGFTVEGSSETWPDHYGSATLPKFNSFQPSRSFIDVYALGIQPFDTEVTAVEPWIELSPEITPEGDQRYWVEIDWEHAPEGPSTGTIKIAGTRGAQEVHVPIVKATASQAAAAAGRFASLDGPVSFAASDAPIQNEVDGVRWEKIPDLGRGQAAMGIYPVTAASVLPPQPAPNLEYPVYLPEAGEHTVTLEIGPVMDFVPDRGMRIAVSFNDATPQILDIFSNRERETFLGASWWSQYTKDGIRYLRSKHSLATAGAHTLKITMVDPGIVLEKVTVQTRRIPDSYFGPPAQGLLEAER